MPIFRKREQVGLPLASGVMILLGGIVGGPLGALAISGVVVGITAKVRKKRLGYADTKTEFGEAYSLLTNVASPLVTGSITGGDILSSAVGEIGSHLATRSQKRLLPSVESQDPELNINAIPSWNTSLRNKYLENGLEIQTQETKTLFSPVLALEPKNAISSNTFRIGLKKCPKCGVYSPYNTSKCIYCVTNSLKDTMTADCSTFKTKCR